MRTYVRLCRVKPWECPAQLGEPAIEESERVPAGVTPTLPPPHLLRCVEPPRPGVFGYQFEASYQFESSILVCRHVGWGVLSEHRGLEGEEGEKEKRESLNYHALTDGVSGAER